MLEPSEARECKGEPERGIVCRPIIMLRKLGKSKPPKFRQGALRRQVQACNCIGGHQIEGPSTKMAEEELQ